MQGRKLAVVRIRDVEQPEFDQPSDADVPGFFDNFCAIASAGKVHRISGAAAAQVFWKSANRLRVPDLILADVNFERDFTSPLATLFGKIPTGILYALPFLTWSRVGASLSVLTFNTSDPNVFKEQAEEPMRLLAAELGAVAMAVAGDLDELVSPNDLEPVYRWLRTTSGSEDASLHSAIEEFRRRLLPVRNGLDAKNQTTDPMVVISPASYVRLFTLSENAAAASSSGRINIDDWPGLELIYADGRRDSIALRSLFGEVPSFQAGDFGSSWTGVDPARLDENGRPPIGGFLSALSAWRQMFEDAAQAELGLPTRDKQLLGATLTDVVPFSSDGSHRYVRPLTIVFHLIRQAQEEWRDWVSAYQSEDWEVRTASGERVFVQGTTPERVYSDVWRVFRTLGSESEFAEAIDSPSLLEAIRGGALTAIVPDENVRTLSRRPEWLDLVLEGLESLGLIKRVRSDGHDAWEVRRSGALPAPVPMAGRTRRPSWTNRTTLLKNLGLSPNSHTQLYDMCDLLPVISGSEFLAKLFDGRCEIGWIRELGKEFAVHKLGWVESREWPLFLTDAATPLQGPVQPPTSP